MSKQIGFGIQGTPPGSLAAGSTKAAPAIPGAQASSFFRREVLVDPLELYRPGDANAHIVLDH